MISTNKKIDIKQGVGPIAIGRVTNYKVSFDKLDSNEKQKLYNLLVKEIKKATNDIYEMYNAQSIRGVGWCNSEYRPLHIFESQPYHEKLRDYVLKRDMPLEQAMEESLQDYINEQEGARHYPNTYDELDHVYETFEYIKSTARHAYVKLFYSKIKRPTIIVSDVFSRSFFYEMPKWVRGFIFKNKVNKFEPYAFAREYSLSVVFSDFNFEDNTKVIITPFKYHILVNPTSSRLKAAYLEKSCLEDLSTNSFDTLNKKHKIYIMNPNKNDIHMIAESKWYDGICVYRSELKYLSYGRVPQFKIFFDEFAEILSALDHKEMMFQIPYFHEKLSISDKKFDTYAEAFMEEYHIYFPWIESLAKVSAEFNKEIHIAIPGVINKSDYLKMFILIESIFMYYNAPAPKMGYVMNTIEMFDAYENYVDADFIVIALDDIIEQIDDYMGKYETEYKAEVVMKLIGEQITSAHQFYRLTTIKQRHIVMGRCLAEKDIFHRLRTKGFTEFAIPKNNLHIVVPYIDTVIKSRGNFVGVHARNKLIRVKKKYNKAPRAINAEDNKYVIKTREERLIEARLKAKSKKMSK